MWGGRETGGLGRVVREISVVYPVFHFFQAYTFTIEKNIIGDSDCRFVFEEKLMMDSHKKYCRYRE